MSTEPIHADFGDDPFITRIEQAMTDDLLDPTALEDLATILLDRILAYIALANRLTAHRNQAADACFRRDWRNQLLEAPIPPGALWITRIGDSTVPATIGPNRAIRCYEDAEKLRFVLSCMARRHRNALDLLERRYQGTRKYALRASLAFHHAVEIEKMLEEVYSNS